MTGSRFVRADLHVHTHSDSDLAPAPDFDRYIQTAIDQGIDVLAITDHNRVDFVRPALAAAAGKSIFLLPGIEISTHDGHLLALFAPERLDALDALAAPGNLKLTVISDTERRSTRSMLDLVQEIASAGGLGIPAHIDAGKGAGTRLSGAQWAELLTSPALAGLEFATKDALTTWFTDEDSDDARRAAWKAREKIAGLAERGLARLMSSDAHSPDQVGRDRASRTLTRLRLDDANFTAVRNAIALNPKARCKAEVVLPATYPRIEKAEFEGGFLDGVTLDFTANLNCLIGGRGSGKSTALLSIRAALGARLSPDEDPDDADRMPTKTSLTFVDATGSRRTAIRERGQDPVDPTGAPVRLRLADLGQEETGRLAQNYNDDPALLLEFLDGFIVRHKYDEREAELIGSLEENASEILRTSGDLRADQKAGGRGVATRCISQGRDGGSRRGDREVGHDPRLASTDAERA
ncbi:MAG TPA: AAA family ATPase [Solirubrobacteraceae bacterium]